jgi:hypothetical protein
MRVVNLDIEVSCGASRAAGLRRLAARALRCPGTSVGVLFLRVMILSISGTAGTAPRRTNRSLFVQNRVESRVTPALATR